MNAVDIAALIALLLIGLLIYDFVKRRRKRPAIALPALPAFARPPAPSSQHSSLQEVQELIDQILKDRSPRAAVSVLSPPTDSQTPDTTALVRMINELRQKISLLEQEVEYLKLERSVARLEARMSPREMAAASVVTRPALSTSDVKQSAQLTPQHKQYNRSAKIALFVGTVGLVASIAWWGLHFQQLVDETSTGGVYKASMLQILRCTYSANDFCGLVHQAAAIRGEIPYNPMAFWASVAVLAFGFFLYFRHR